MGRERRTRRRRVQMAFTRNGTRSAWLPVQTVDADTLRILLSGADTDPGDAHVLDTGRTQAELRLTDDPDIVPRSGGVIDVPAR